MRRTYSYSKRETLESCARRYFYEYYAAAKGVPFDSARKPLAKQLKALTNRHMLAGNLLHGLIETRLKKGLNWSASWFVRKAAERFDQAVAFSRNPVPVTRGFFAPQVLGEVAYGDQEDEIGEARIKLLHAISNFLEHPAVTAVYGHFLEGTYAVEQRLSGLKLADFAVGGKIDFLSRGPRGVEILDWKMGSEEGNEDSLQLFTYGLWSGVKYGEPPERIRARKIFLTGPSIGQEVQLSQSLMNRGRARMVQDIELMKELDVLGREGSEEAFSPCDRINVCRQCNFRAICSAGSKAMKSRPTFKSLAVLQTAS